ncbi:AraC family transcriptional regulator [Lichenicoccus roseus]|uniref:Helix-turn-helix domain-containing protein n=1 Tax=Lichenicoccus roseus TaxID=2683649 RepID=A0A5R9JGB8_9PROT|nr:AraC family transcriptional regulator [Lichenicoccus roseus]TLU74466.1 helix-turn-helix domain-containing protein [Lichenicoccus roseus]
MQKTCRNGAPGTWPSNGCATAGARAEPELEIVAAADGTPFKMWSHGYPFRTVRWHFHPEYEIHLITATTGRMFVGDHVGAFVPGNLVMTGPNLPHNWLSDVEPGTTIPERCLVLQFTEAFIACCRAAFPEFDLTCLVEDCQRGVQFSAGTGRAAEPLLRAMLDGSALSRPALFFQLLELLVGATDRRMLASIGYRAKPAIYMTRPINHVLEHIARNLDCTLREGEMAELSGYSPSAFSRAFHRQIGLTFTAYVNGMRINRACRLLTTSDRTVTEICFETGFNNVSNFNRQFLSRTAMTPRAYRRHHRANDRYSMKRTDHSDIDAIASAGVSGPDAQSGDTPRNVQT